MRLLRAKVDRGEISEDEAGAILGKSVWEAQGKVPALWPTPRESEQENRTRRRTPSQEAGTHGNYLSAEVFEAMLPTPRVMPGNVSNVNGKAYETSLQSMARKGILEPENPATGMKLSAAWVSRLMGYPDGWLDLD